jgi:tRNA uridine 5-carboxymethylaminomethyl modification enzyme
MFTSRAEFRLALRADNADQRLTPLGIALGCVGDLRRSVFDDKLERLTSAKNRLSQVTYTPKQIKDAGVSVNQDGSRRSGFDLLAFPDVDFGTLLKLDSSLSDIDDEVRQQIARDALYFNYIERQKRDVAAMQRDEGQKIPADFNFMVLEGLSNELKGKLDKARPETLAQAGRIDGMTPAAMTLLLAKLRQAEKKRVAR